MPRGSHVLGTPIDETKWEEAKKRAAEEGHDEDWDYIMEIYKRMSHSGEFRPKFIGQRKKKRQTLSEWKQKTKDWKKKRVLSTKKSIDLVDDPGYTKRVKLALLKDQILDEFRCGVCGLLLLRGVHLEKSIIEVKCKRCKNLIVNI